MINPRRAAFAHLWQGIGRRSARSSSGLEGGAGSGDSESPSDRRDTWLRVFLLGVDLALPLPLLVLGGYDQSVSMVTRSKQRMRRQTGRDNASDPTQSKPNACETYHDVEEARKARQEIAVAAVAVAAKDEDSQVAA